MVPIPSGTGFPSGLYAVLYHCNKLLCHVLRLLPVKKECKNSTVFTYEYKSMKNNSALKHMIGVYVQINVIVTY